VRVRTERTVRDFDGSQVVRAGGGLVERIATRRLRTIAYLFVSLSAGAGWRKPGNGMALARSLYADLCAVRG
jgi:hypothetical protein